MASDCCWSWPIRWFLCTALLQGLAVGLRASEGSAVDLSHKNFDTFLDGLPPDITVLMEFYANWCAHHLPRASEYLAPCSCICSKLLLPILRSPALKATALGQVQEKDFFLSSRLQPGALVATLY